MERELLDKMLEIIEINKNKKEILNNMADLELNGMSETNEYINLINLYKRLASNLIKIIREIDINDSLIITRTISRLNPVLYQAITFDDILDKADDQYLSFKKLFVDLGAKLLVLYKEDAQDQLKKEIAYVCALFGIDVSDEDEIEVDTELINDYMTSDFTNVLYSEIVKLLNFANISLENKKELLKLKYNLIYLAPNIESRAIETAFSIPDVPRLTDINKIIDTGIDYSEYLNKLDGIMIELLDFLVNNCLHMSNMNNKSLELIDLVFIKTYASTLNNSELLDLISLDKTNVNSKNYIIASNLIEEALNQSRIEVKNNSKIRMYGRI